MRSINTLRKIRRFVARSLIHLKPGPAYRYRAGDVVIEDFAEFSGIPLHIVAEKVGNFHRINAEDWKALEAGSLSERAAGFYESGRERNDPGLKCPELRKVSAVEGKI